MKKYVIDTSLIISYFLSEDPLHENALKLFTEKDIFNQYINCSDFVLSEILTVAIYKWWINFSKFIFDTINKLDHFQLHKQDIQYIINNTFFLKEKISICDVSWIILAIHTWSELLTFDKQQKKIYNKFRNYFE